jgi:hypothetical protein
VVTGHSSTDRWNADAVYDLGIPIDAGLRLVVPRERNPFAEVFDRKAGAVHPNQMGLFAFNAFITVYHGGDEGKSLKETHRRACLANAEFCAEMEDRADVHFGKKTFYLGDAYRVLAERFRHGLYLDTSLDIDPVLTEMVDEIYNAKRMERIDRLFKGRM